jgi:predicted RecA/RadA family phage recombinase
MSNNFIQPGETLPLIAPYDVSAGGGALVGSIFGIASENVLEDAPGEFETCGVFEHAKTSAQAWTQGQKIYWDNTNKRFDSDGTLGPLVGVAALPAANPTATGTVRLNGSAPSSSEGPQPAIVSLTDNGGGAAADGTIGVVTAPTAIAATLVDSTGLSGTHDDTLAATTVPADIAGGESPTEAEHNSLLAVVRVMAQNASDTGQKVIEIVTAQAEDRTALVALTDAVKELSTKQNAVLTALRAAGVIAT